MGSRGTRTDPPQPGWPRAPLTVASVLCSQAIRALRDEVRRLRRRLEESLRHSRSHPEGKATPCAPPGRRQPVTPSSSSPKDTACSGYVAGGTLGWGAWQQPPLVGGSTISHGCGDTPSPRLSCFCSGPGEVGLMRMGSWAVVGMEMHEVAMRCLSGDNGSVPSTGSRVPERGARWPLGSLL